MSAATQARSATASASLLSVIVPLGPDEKGIGRLRADLLLLPLDTEIIFVTCRQNTPFDDRRRIDRSLRHYRVSWLQAATGRAQQLNAGAAAASGRFLWFLHADSGFGPELLRALPGQLSRAPEALHYCRLAFMPDGPSGMGLNQWGADLRSRWLGVPFGDQGFCIAAGVFHNLQGYPEDAAYGEDHLFVWRVRQAGYPLKCTEQPLYTSARKYSRYGWGALTLRYQYLWLKQALPQWWKLHFSR